jgi:hypothetical protein
MQSLSKLYSDEHWASACPDRKYKQEKKSANMVISETREGTSRYGNSLPFVLSVCLSPEWWMDNGASIHVCADVSLFTSYQVGRTGALLMGNGSHERVLSAGTVVLKFTSGKTVLALLRCVAMALKLCLSPINVLCRDMEHLLENVMIAEACSAYLCLMMCVIKW